MKILSETASNYNLQLASARKNERTFFSVFNQKYTEIELSGHVTHRNWMFGNRKIIIFLNLILNIRITIVKVT